MSTIPPHAYNLNRFGKMLLSYQSVIECYELALHASMYQVYRLAFSVMTPRLCTLYSKQQENFMRQKIFLGFGLRAVSSEI